MSLGYPFHMRRSPAGASIARPLARRYVLAAIWLASVALAVTLSVQGTAANAWNAPRAVEIVLLFAAPWALAWLLRNVAGRYGGADPGAAVDSDWVAVVARLTGYSVTINDAERRLVWVNESFTRLTGYSAAEAIGQHTSELLYFEGTDADTIALVRESFAARRGIRFEILVRGKDGREWWLDTDARPLLDTQGQVS